MTKAEVKKELIKKKSDSERIVDWNWNLWKSDKAVTIITITKNHVAYCETFYVDDNYLRFLPDCTKFM